MLLHRFSGCTAYKHEQSDSVSRSLHTVHFVLTLIHTSSLLCCRYQQVCFCFQTRICRYECSMGISAVTSFRKSKKSEKEEEKSKSKQNKTKFGEQDYSYITHWYCIFAYYSLLWVNCSLLWVNASKILQNRTLANNSNNDSDHFYSTLLARLRTENNDCCELFFRRIFRRVS